MSFKEVKEKIPVHSKIQALSKRNHYFRSGKKVRISKTKDGYNVILYSLVKVKEGGNEEKRLR